MEKITIDGREIILKKDINNMFLSEFKSFFNSVTSTGDTEYHELDKQTFQISLISGLSVEELEDIDIIDLKELSVKSYEMFNKEFNVEPILDIETSKGKFSINKKEDGNFKITTADIKVIRANIIKGDGKVSEMDFINKIDVLAAILFRDETKDLSPEAIISRASIFNNEMTVGHIYPYILKIIDKFR